MNQPLQPIPAYPTIDFGARMGKDDAYFAVSILRDKTGKVLIYECHGDERVTFRARLNRSMWDEIAASVAAEFNERLKAKGRRPARWRTGTTKLDPLLGKELCVLAWALEDVSLAFAPTSLTNWDNLKPEERWWLFTMTAAASGEVDDRLGWRKALRYALTENPVRGRRPR